MPGCEKSAPNAARPVTFSRPSGRMVRLPIHLLSVEPFAVMAVLPSFARPFACLLRVHPLARLLPVPCAAVGFVLASTRERTHARGAHAPGEPGPILKGSALRATVEGAARVCVRPKLGSAAMAAKRRTPSAGPLRGKRSAVSGALF